MSMTALGNLDGLPVEVEYDYEPAQIATLTDPPFGEVFSVVSICGLDKNGKYLADITENLNDEVFKYFETQLLERAI